MGRKRKMLVQAQQQREQVIRATHAASKQPFQALAALFDQQAVEMMQKAETSRAEATDPVVGESLYQYFEGYSRGIKYCADQIRLNLGLQNKGLEQAMKGAQEQVMLTDDDEQDIPQ